MVNVTYQYLMNHIGIITEIKSFKVWVMEIESTENGYMFMINDEIGGMEYGIGFEISDSDSFVRVYLGNIDTLPLSIPLLIRSKINEYKINTRNKIYAIERKKFEEIITDICKDFETREPVSFLYEFQTLHKEYMRKQKEEYNARLEQQAREMEEERRRIKEEQRSREKRERERDKRIKQCKSWRKCIKQIC